MQNPDRVITEEDLQKYYADNGVVVQTERMVKSYLKKKGFFKEPDSKNSYRNQHGKLAFVYKTRDAVFDKTGQFRKYKFQGFLISFGGEAVSCYKLKFTKIPRPQF